MEDNYGICPDTGLPYAGIRSGGRGRLLGRGQGLGPLGVPSKYGLPYNSDTCPSTGLPYAGIRSGGQGRLLGRGQGYGPLRTQARYKLPKEVIETYSLLGTLPLEGLEWWSWEDINKWGEGASGIIKSGGGIWDTFFGGGGGGNAGGGSGGGGSGGGNGGGGSGSAPSFPTGLVIAGVGLIAMAGLLIYATTRTSKGKK